MSSKIRINIHYSEARPPMDSWEHAVMESSRGQKTITNEKIAAGNVIISLASVARPIRARIQQQRWHGPPAQGTT
jgi:hypothetical protein